MRCAGVVRPSVAVKAGAGGQRYGFSSGTERGNRELKEGVDNTFSQGITMYAVAAFYRNYINDLS